MPKKSKVLVIVTWELDAVQDVCCQLDPARIVVLPADGDRRKRDLLNRIIRRFDNNHNGIKRPF